MHLVQILLPLQDNEGIRFPREPYADVRQALLNVFEGLTAFVHSPAEGIWQDESDDVSHDQIVIFEVMAPDLDREWWRDFRGKLEKMFKQEKIVVRVQTIEVV